ncbi:Vps51/Vps67-domain-containing protein, partial [Cladochytrium replicatum]
MYSPNLQNLRVSPSSSGTLNSQPRKARTLLQAYYLGNNDQGQKETPKAKADPLDLDSHALNPELYVNKSLNEDTLAELIAKDNDLVSDIRDLDGEMKTLVYENYNRFISATDSIRKMRESVTNMELELSHLTTNTAHLTSTSSKLHSTLSASRSQTATLSATRALLTQLSFVYDLPSRLEACVKKGDDAGAVKWVKKTREVVRRYRDRIAAFARVERECGVIVEEMEGRLRKRVEDGKSTVEQCVNSVGLLLALNTHHDDIQLQKTYLKTIQLQLNKIKMNAVAHVATMSGDSEYQLASDRAAYLDKSVLIPLAQLVSVYEEGFVSAASASPEQRAEAVKAIDGVLNSFIVSYMDIIRDLVRRPPNAQNYAEYFSVLDLVYHDIQSLALSSMAATLIGGHTKRLIDSWISEVFDNLAERSRIAFIDRVKIDSSEPDTRNFAAGMGPALVTELTGACVPQMLQLVQPDSNYGKSSPGVIPNLVASMYTRINDFWPSLVSHCVTQSEDLNSSKLDVLLWSRVLLELASKAIEPVYRTTEEQVKEVAGKRGTLSKRMSGGIPLKIVTGDGDGSGNDGAKEAGVACRRGAQTLLTRYVELSTSELTQHLRVALPTLARPQSEPERPSLIWDALLATLATIHSDLGKLYDDESPVRRNTSAMPRHSRAGSAALGGSGGASSTYRSRASSIAPTGAVTGAYDPMWKTIDKLFAERIDFVTRIVDVSRGGVESSIVKILVKAYMEEIRTLTFNLYGFQQLHLDVELLRRVLPRYIYDDRLLNSLLDEVVASAFRRTVDRDGVVIQPLDAAVVERKLEVVVGGRRRGIGEEGSVSPLRKGLAR